MQNKLAIGSGGSSYNYNNNLMYSSINKFAKMGGNIIDTGVKYNCSQVIRKIIKESNNKLYIISKQRPIDYNNEQEIINSFNKDVLSGLDVNYIDEMVIHTAWGKERGESETKYKNHRINMWKAYIKLKIQGKIKKIGLSTFSIEQIEELVNETNVEPETLHLEYNIFNHDEKMYNYCIKNNIKMYAFSCLGKRSQRKKLNTIIINKLMEKYKCSFEALCLSWLISKKITPIFASKNKDHIEYNLNNIFTLEKDDILICDHLQEAIQITKYNIKYITKTIIEIDNIIRPDLFENLYNTFPKQLKNGDGAQFEYFHENSNLYKEILKNENWKELESFLDNQNCFDMMFNLFKKHINDELKDEFLLNTNKLIIEPFRKNDTYEDTSYLIEDIVRKRKKDTRKIVKKTIFSRLNFATKGDIIGKEPHRDHENRLISGLIYYNNFNNNDGGKTQFWDGPNVNNKGKLIYECIPKKNKGIIFLNCRNSIHSVIKNLTNETRKTNYFMYCAHESSWKYISGIND